MQKLWLCILICLAMMSSSLPHGPQQLLAQENPVVQIQLEHMRVANDQEDGIFSNGDEPYFVVIAFRSRFKTPNSTSTHWNGYLAELGHRETGEEFDIPTEMGLVALSDVHLVTLDDIAAGRRFPELIGVLVVSMESDATPFGDIRNKMNELKGALEGELRRLIENGELDLGNLNKDTLSQAVDHIKASTAVSFWEGLGLWLKSWTDPDDKIAYHLYAYLTVDSALSSYLPTIDQPDLTFGTLNSQRYEIGSNPAIFAGDDANYEVTLAVTSNATVQPVSVNCEAAYQSFSRLFLPVVHGGANTGDDMHTTTTLDVAQYNVQFLTPWNGSEVPGHKPNTTGRATAIGHALACYDVVALNETVNDDRRNEIVAAMNERAPLCGKPKLLSGDAYFFVAAGPSVDEQAIKGVGDGLNAILNRPGEPIVGDEVMIISRLPIVQVDSHTYQARSGIDRLAAKGVLHARLRDPAPDSTAYLDVFATHLQASGDNTVKRCQVAELTDFVRTHSNPKIPVMLLGDFNIDGLPGAQVDPNSTYTYLMNAFTLKSGHSLQDIGWQLVKGTNLGDTEQQTRRIDYIFISSPGLTSDTTTVLIQRFDNNQWGTLSDHAAVEAKVTWMH